MSTDTQAGTFAAFTERAAALLEEGHARAAEIEQARQALMVERDEEVSKVKASFAERIGELDSYLATLRRLERALERDRPAKAKVTKPKAEEGRGRTANVSKGTRAAVLNAMAEGAETVGDIAQGIGMSRQTAFNAVDVLREEGVARLAGEGAKLAKLYRLTPEGTKEAAALANGNGDKGDVENALWHPSS